MNLLAIIFALVSTDEPVAIPATFVRVIDGDTYEMRAHLPFGVHIDVTVRLEGIDTPEINKGLQKKAGLAAKAFAETWSTTYPDVVIYDTGAISFDRKVSTVCPTGGGKCLAEALRDGGHEKVSRSKR